MFDLKSGTYYSYNLDLLRDDWEKNVYLNPLFRGCFATYFSYYKPDKTLYFYFPSVPTWFPKIIDEFNENFQNIKYVIIDNKSAWISDNTNRYKGIKITFDKGGYEKEVYRPLLCIEFNENYKTNSIKYLTYSLSILMRMTSHAERYIDNHDEDPQENYLQKLVDINNSNRGYRSFSQNNISIDGLKKYDDIEVVNGGLKRYTSSSIKQTAIYRNITKGHREFKPRGRFKLAYNKGGFLRSDYSLYWAERWDENQYSYGRNWDLISSRGKTFKTEEEAQQTLNKLNQSYFKDRFHIVEMKND